MADIINLRQARKRRERERKNAEAEANRAAFGRTKAEREGTRTERDLAERLHEGHRIDKEPE
jgi:hypothetical protein